MLKDFYKIENAKLVSAKTECVLIKIQCDTYKSLYDVLTYTTSKEYKEKLDSIAKILTSHCDAKNLLVIRSDISIDCCQIFRSTEETIAEQKKTPVLQSIHGEMGEAVEEVVEHFDVLCSTLSRKLEGMSDLISKMNEDKHYLGSSVQKTTLVTDKKVLCQSVVEDDDKRKISPHAQYEETPVSKSSQTDEISRSVHSGEAKLVVAAIDIGNTFIANAYSYGHDFERDHLELHIYQDMENTSGIQPSKIPTVALFDDKNIFHSLGYEAEAKYAQLLEDAEDDRIQCQWRFFGDLSLNTLRNEQYVLEDDRKQTMPALDVYVAILKCLKGHIFNYLLSRINGLSEIDIYWIFPVPISYSERQFFIRAAEKACFPTARLAFLPKPKAAAIYCKELVSSKYTGNFKKDLIPGEKILVVDAGCHTLSVTAHRIMSNGSIADLESFSDIDVSGAGCLVDVNLEILIKNIFGVDVLERFRRECKIDALELNDSIEMMKLQFKDPENEKMDFSYWLNVPSNLFETFKTMNGYRLFERRRREDQIVHIPTKGNKIYISNEVVLDFFKGLKVHLIRKLREILKDDRLRDVKTMVFVGGLSDSEILRNELRHSFPMKTIIFPDKASTAIVKGAVIYGHTTDAFF